MQLGVHTAPGRRGKTAIEVSGVIDKLDSTSVLVSDAWSQSWAGKLLHFLEALNAEVRAARRPGGDRLEQEVLMQRLDSLERVLVLAHKQNPDPPRGGPARRGDRRR